MAGPVLRPDQATNNINIQPTNYSISTVPKGTKIHMLEKYSGTAVKRTA